MVLVAALFALLFHVGTMPWLARLLDFSTWYLTLKMPVTSPITKAYSQKV